MECKTSQTGPPTQGEPVPHRIRKLYRVTWVVAAAVATVLFLLNYATFAVIEHDFSLLSSRQSFGSDKQVGRAQYLCLGHGWPWTFLRREENGRENWSIFAGARDFQPLVLLADVAIAVLITAGVALVLRRRNRFPRRWFQIRLSTLLVVILIVAFGVQYVLQQYRAYDLLERMRDETVSLVLYQPRNFGPLALGPYGLPTQSKYAKPAFVDISGYAYGHGFDPRPLIDELVRLDPSACSMWFTITNSWTPGGAYEWAFEIPFQNIHCSVNNNGTFEPLKRMQQLRHLWIEQPTVDDLADLSALGDLHNLELLAITGPGMKELTDDDFEFLATLNNLQVLAIGPCRVTGAVFNYAAKMPKLRTFCLAGRSLHDEDLAPLAKLTQLRRLEIDATHLTDESLDKLNQSSPWLDVMKLNEYD